MAETLYRKCPVCKGTTYLPAPVRMEPLPWTPKPCHCQGSDTPGFVAVGSLVAGIIADRGRLRTALEQCDVVMDTAATFGLPQGLPEAYRDSWARVHTEARAALAATEG
jgi:hypothetical protein